VPRDTRSAFVSLFDQHRPLPSLATPTIAMVNGVAVGCDATPGHLATAGRAHRRGRLERLATFSSMKASFS
jgi:hypothetical protein